MSKDEPSPGSQTILGWLKNALTREPQDLPELVEILRNSETRNLLDPDVLAMVEGALHVSTMQVRDIMVPRIQMVAIEMKPGRTRLSKPYLNLVTPVSR